MNRLRFGAARLHSAFLQCGDARFACIVLLHLFRASRFGLFTYKKNVYVYMYVYTYTFKCISFLYTIISRKSFCSLLIFSYQIFRIFWKIFYRTNFAKFITDKVFGKFYVLQNPRKLYMPICSCLYVDGATPKIPTKFLTLKERSRNFSQNNSH